MADLDPVVRAAYLDRLGLDAEPPSADALRRLHRRHAERVPYETWWIHAGEAWSTDPHEAARRIALECRGGYCYHLNGAFALLLRSLGYRVSTHLGGVHGPDGPTAEARGNHLVLSVAGLATDANPEGGWYVDVGLGDALHEPMPLAAGAVRQGPFLLTLTTSDDGGWHLQHDPAGSFAGMAWTTAPADDETMHRQHGWLSTSPESGFVKLGLAQTRDADGVDVVHGLVVKRAGRDARSDEPLTDRKAWFEALAALFGLTFASSAPGTCDRLWERTLAAHRAWEATQV
jgi:N-hydroxyarylamine O-acetyltransferase